MPRSCVFCLLGRCSLRPQSILVKWWVESISQIHLCPISCGLYFGCAPNEEKRWSVVLHAVLLPFPHSSCHARSRPWSSGTCCDFLFPFDLSTDVPEVLKVFVSLHDLYDFGLIFENSFSLSSAVTFLCGSVHNLTVVVLFLARTFCRPCFMLLLCFLVWTYLNKACVTALIFICVVGCSLAVRPTL